MTTVYRVENIDQRGPYTSCLVTWQDGAHTPATGRPGPAEDGLDQVWQRFHYASRFGFTSLEALQRWFAPTERERLARLGFHVAVIETDEVWEGECQCIYVESGSYRVQTIELVSLTEEYCPRPCRRRTPEEIRYAKFDWIGVEEFKPPERIKVPRMPWIEPLYKSMSWIEPLYKSMSCENLLRVSNTWQPLLRNGETAVINWECTV